MERLDRSDVQKVTCAVVGFHVLLRWISRAVTLISGGPSIDAPSWKMLKVMSIVTQGVEEGQYYRTFSHLYSVGFSFKGTVQHVKQPNPLGEVRFRHKTKTWVRSEQLVSNMITHITGQVGKEIEFNPFWKNCAQWATQILRFADIPVPCISGWVNGTEAYIEQIEKENIP